MSNNYNPYHSEYGPTLEIFITPIDGTDDETVGIIWKDTTNSDKKAGFHMRRGNKSVYDTIKYCIDGYREVMTSKDSNE